MKTLSERMNMTEGDQQGAHVITGLTTEVEFTGLVDTFCTIWDAQNTCLGDVDMDDFFAARYQFCVYIMELQERGVNTMSIWFDK